MKIKHTIIYDVEGEAPFKGAVIHATTESKGVNYRNPSNIIKDVIDFENDGLIFTGEWYKRGKQFVELIKEIENYPKLKTMIYTELTIDEFMFEMGLLFWNNTSPVRLKRKNAKDEMSMLQMIGATVLDNYLTSEETDRYFVMAKHEGENRVYQMTRNDEDMTEEVMN